MLMKNCNDVIGNRNRDLPACSAVPHSTAPLRIPSYQPSCPAELYTFLSEFPKAIPLKPSETNKDEPV